ncbi:MAG: 2-hydroxychromene-2-carboxylate isomerase [Pseudomonadales bacterium]|nr:2-hydroxychromene-2-carboxylate isomerase [Pseudomonadales bacterium]
MKKVEFFFDCSSPWTYLAFAAFNNDDTFKKCEVVWKPILVGGLFNTVNPSVYESRANPVPIKQTYYQKDLADWARFVGIEIGNPPVFPVNSVKVMRGAFVAQEAGKLVEYALIAFHRYWGELRDISQDEEVRSIAVSAGLDVDAFWQKVTSQTYKDKLKANTDELITRGGFGSPTLFVNETDMYFGNDRLPLVAQALCE